MNAETFAMISQFAQQEPDLGVDPEVVIDGLVQEITDLMRTKAIQAAAIAKLTTENTGLRQVLSSVIQEIDVEPVEPEAPVTEVTLGDDENPDPRDGIPIG